MIRSRTVAMGFDHVKGWEADLAAEIDRVIKSLTENRDVTGVNVIPLHLSHYNKPYGPQVPGSSVEPVASGVTGVLVNVIWNE